MKRLIVIATLAACLVLVVGTVTYQERAADKAESGAARPATIEVLAYGPRNLKEQRRRVHAQKTGVPLPGMPVQNLPEPLWNHRELIDQTIYRIADLNAHADQRDRDSSQAFSEWQRTHPLATKQEEAEAAFSDFERLRMIWHNDVLLRTQYERDLEAALGPELTAVMKEWVESTEAKLYEQDLLDRIKKYATD